MTVKYLGFLYLPLSKAELEEGLISAAQFADGLAQLLEVINDGDDNDGNHYEHDEGGDHHR